MSRYQNQYTSCTYAELQDRLYDTHEGLQEFSAHIAYIHTRLIRTSSVILDALMYPTHIQHTESFRNFRRDLNNLIHQLAKLNYDLGESMEYLVPF